MDSHAKCQLIFSGRFIVNADFEFQSRLSHGILESELHEHFGRMTKDFCKSRGLSGAHESSAFFYIAKILARNSDFTRELRLREFIASTQRLNGGSKSERAAKKSV